MTQQECGSKSQKKLTCVCSVREWLRGEERERMAERGREPRLREWLREHVRGRGILIPLFFVRI